ncbi:ribokinase [soil metagenome]
MKSKITVIGSSNTDMVIQTSKFPAPGETIIGGKFFMNPGGKGANQAVAAARLGGRVSLIAKVGDDIFGKQSMDNFEKEGIDTSCMATDKDYPSGVALITVDSKGENHIVVASGANAHLNPQDIDAAMHVLENSSFVLMQLEIPLATVEYVAKTCFQKNIQVILDPAPAQTLSETLLQNLYLVTPNKTEAEQLSGIKVNNRSEAEKAAEKIIEMGAKNVIITLGSEGALIKNMEMTKFIPAPIVEPIDSTAAGDIFNGALAVALSENYSLEEAVEFANKAASISVTRMGAQSSAPYKNEVFSSN